LKQIKSKAYHKDRKSTISVEQRVKLLERTGLKIQYQNNDVILTNALYPNMFYTMCAMARIVSKEKGSGDNSFTYCDFRQLCKGYKYDKYDNAFIFLNDEDKSIALQLDGIAQKLKLTRSIKSGFCPGYAVNYSYKKNLLMSLNSMSNSLNVSIRFLYDVKKAEPIYHLFEAFAKDSDELKTFVYNRLLRCSRCYTGCTGYADVGWPMQIYGKLNKMCVYTDRMGIYMPDKPKNKNFIKSDDLPLIEKTLSYVKELADETQFD